VTGHVTTEQGPRNLGPLLGTIAALAVAACGIAVSAPVAHRGWTDVALHGFGVLAIVIGARIWLGTSRPRIGALIVLTGAAFHLGDLRAAMSEPWFAAGFCLAYLWTAVLAHIALALPGGRLGSAGARALVAVAYAGAVGTQVVRYVVDSPVPPWWWNHNPGPPSATAVASSVTYVAVTVATLAVVVRRWVSATSLHRRHGAAQWGTVVVAGLGGISAALVALSGAGSVARTVSLLVACALLACAVPLAVAARRLHLELACAQAARTVLGQFGGGHDTAPVVLQRALADAVGDPTLVLHYPGDGGSFLDVRGRPVTPGPSPGRAVTRVHRDGALVAVVEHDETLAEQRRVVDVALDIAGLAITGAARRLPDAAFAERHRIQRDLHDGPQQQLFGAMLLLDMARTGSIPVDGALHRAHGLIGQAVVALRELTQRIYPETLVEHGLAAAVAQLGALSPIPVLADVPAVRWPPDLELTAYFLVSEAVANVYKHADASAVTVTVRETRDALVLEISDDGTGGTGGTGEPRALRLRAASVGGSVAVSSEPGRGTTVSARLPIGVPCG
jgi:signal transduction histidine kinase